MRHSLKLVALLATAGLTLAAIPALAVDLRVTYSPANFSKMYEAVAAAFMEEHPDITITYENATSYDELLQRTLRAVLINDAPDVSHQGLNYLRVFKDQDIVVPLDAFIAAEPNWADLGYTDAVTSIGAVGDATYAVPFSISTPVLVFNLDLVRQAGGDPDNLPTTWEGVFNLASKINALGNGVIGINIDYSSNAALGFQTLLFGEGGRMMTPDESDIAFDGPQGLRALQLLAQAADAGQVDMSRDNARQTLIAGKIGIYETASSILGTLQTQVADRFEYVMAPVPLVDGGTAPASGNGMVMLTKDPERQAAAWEYIKFASSARGQAIMAAMTGYLPVNAKALEDPALAQLYRDQPNYAVPLSQLGDLTGWYAFPGKNGSKIAAMIVEKMQQVLTRKSTPEDALAEAATEARALLAQ
ncbi:ABC transporter substrate-binding protein [Mesorhizobium sp.]|uniref:ABC transporter substrate-binding protein n=1 Tax=Mesorhizobium sp. TaxID=1871066 RepID=UPI000FE9EED2|nr:ABC transporter substrate-binding protein [Mesorhizobium sp.]RWD42782.1 MAG: ABC transporter substrate-binding protein [Mesorhizobium sp.]